MYITYVILNTTNEGNLGLFGERPFFTSDAAHQYLTIFLKRNTELPRDMYQVFPKLTKKIGA